jgi:hypothetical protein
MARHNLDRGGVEMASWEGRFKVFGSEPGELVRFELKDARDAVQKAKQMIEDGFEETYILGPDGKVYRSDDFHQLLKIS